jgi:hypothetical protein
MESQMTDITLIAKAIGDLAKKGMTIELQERTRQLNQEVLSLQEEIQSLRAENLELKRRADLREKAEFRRKAYWVEGDDVPYCPCCYEKSHLLIHLSGLMTYEGKQHYACPGCETKYVVGPDGEFGIWSDRRRR